MRVPVEIIYAAVVLLAAAAIGHLAAYGLRAWRRARLAREDERFRALVNSMSATVAHEVRNPLSALRGHAQLLRERVPDTDVQGQADRIVHETGRMDSVIRNLVDRWKVKPWRPTPIDPGWAMSEWARSVQVPEIRVASATAPSRWVLDADRLSHALDLMLLTVLSRDPRRASLDLAVFEHSGSLVVHFGTLHGDGRDGRGWLNSDILHQAGFSMVEHVARQHRGSVSVSETADGSLRFRLVLGKV